jgi:hypothetical protein
VHEKVRFKPNVFVFNPLSIRSHLLLSISAPKNNATILISGVRGLELGWSLGSSAVA